MKFSLFLIIYVLLFGLPCWGQPSPLRPKIRYLSVSSVISKIEVHSQYVKNLNNTYPFAIEIDAGYHNFSSRAIELYGCNIRFGVSAAFWQFNHNALGQGVSAMIYVEPFLLAFDRFMVSLKTNAGAIYLTKPYHITRNPNNLAYSTSLAFPLSTGLTFYFPFHYNYAIKVNAGFNHFSNGGIKKPNYGINQTTLSMGFEFSPDRYQVPPRSFQQNLMLQPKKQKHFFEGSVSLAMKDDGVTNAKKSIALAQLIYNYRLTRLNGVGAAALVENFNNSGYANVVLMGGNRFYLGHFGFSQNIGVYLFKGEEHLHQFMHFYTMDYAVTKHLLLGINLKAHKQAASYLGAKIGFCFWK